MAICGTTKNQTLKNHKRIFEGVMDIKEYPDAPVVIHTGFLKCGSTFLQKEVFPKIKNVQMLHKSLGLTYQLFPDKINILSKESFCASHVTTERLHRLFPNAKVIVILRNKEDLKKSTYTTYLKHGGVLTFDEYLELNKDEFKQLLDFDAYLKHVRSLFSDVYVDYLENLKKDNYTFVKGICDFIGVDVPKYNNKRHNINLTKKQTKLCLHLNHLFNNPNYNDNGFLSATRFFSPEIIMRLITGNILNKKWCE